MEFDKLIITVGFVLIATLAFFGTNGIATYYNQQYANYGVSVGQDSDTLTGINNIQNNLSLSFRGIGEDTGTSVEGEEGAGETDANTGLITRSLGIINAIKGTMRMPDNIMTDASIATGLGGEQYIDIAQTMFIILFALAFAYLLFLGINK